MRKLIRRLMTSQYYASIFKQNKEQISELRTLLADQKSKDTLDGILRAYRAVIRKPGYYFTRIADGTCGCYHFTAEDGYRVYGTANPYFLHDIFTLDRNMVYLDGGAYLGDTIQQLLKILHGPCKYIYSFEPNDENYRKMEASVKKYGPIVRCFNAGLDDHNGTAPFLKADASSRVSTLGTDNIHVIDIRSFLAELTENLPTFIKLDIEGKEQEVLNAMSDFIRSNHPDLAVSAYHSLYDLWEIPLQIHRINPDYRVYLRHQSNYFTETVCYAAQP